MRRPEYSDAPKCLRSRRGGRFASQACVGPLAALALGIGAAALPARADGPARAEDWTLYGAPEIAVYAHTGKGNSSSTEITGPRVDPAFLRSGDLGTTIVEPERSREVIASALVGATFGFLTPAIDVPGRPRAFVDLNVSVPMTTEVQLARDGDPGKIAMPRGGGSTGSSVREGAVVGNGTQISAQHQGPHLYAGLGVSFEVPVFDEQLIRFKPSAVYSRTILDIKTLSVRAVRLNNDSGTNQTIEDFREISLSDERTEVYHAAGPSLEIEYLPGLEWGPFSISLFARGNASHIFNGLKTEMTQCNVADGQPEECASWKYTQDRWTYRATLGVHLNWVPRPLW